jgi:hypothetical protein
MPSSVSCGTPLYVDSAADTAQNPFRAYDVGIRTLNAGNAAANQAAGGVYPGGGAMAVTAGSGLNITVAAGLCCVPNSSGGAQGGYLTGLMASAGLSLATADPSNPRLDLVCVTVSDLGTSASNAVVQVVTGTPASSPVAPSLPTGAGVSSLALARVLVAAAASALGSGAVTDLRAYTVTPGGILPIPNPAAAPAVPVTQFMLDLSSGALVKGTGTAGSVAQLPVLPWAPVLALATTPVNDSAARGVLTQICTATVPTDGVTDLELFYKWSGFISAAAPVLVTMSVAIDGVTLDQTVISVPSASVYGAGGSARYWTSAAQGNTPSAGSHTVTFAFQSASTSATTTLTAAANSPATLRVAPAVA